MTTVGSLVVGLSVGTAGLALGLNNAQSQIKAFEARVNGSAAATAQTVAYERLAIAQNNVAVAQAQLNIATLRLTELQAIATTRASTLAAAQLRVAQATHTVAAAQRELAAASAQAAAPSVATSMGGSFPYILGAVTLAGYALLQFSANAARAATEFEYEMVLIQTQAGATAQEVKYLSDAALEMADSVQTGPTELAHALFRLQSVGFNVKDSLEGARVAAMGARVGNADLDSVTNALIATMISGIGGINGMEDAMGKLNAVVGVSNLQMEQLTSSLSSGILSTARQFGLTFNDVGAALATMADQAIPAEEGSTRLRISIALLAAPTQLATRELAKIGLTERSLADEMRSPRGMIGALKLLREHLEGAGLDATEQSMLLKTAFGGSRSSAGILTLMNSLDLLEEKRAAIDEHSGEFLEAWAAQSETAAAKFATFSATMDVLAVRIGNGLIPVLTMLAAVIGFVADKTLIVVPLFWLLVTVLGVALVKTIGSAVAGLISLAVQMVTNVVAAIAMNTAFANLGAGITASAGLSASAVSAFGASMAAASLAAAGFTPAVAGAGGAMAAAGGAAGPLVAGLAGASGAMAATAASSGPVVAGLAGVSGAMAAGAASSGPLVAGLVGVDGAMAAGAATAGPLVAGLVGVDGAMAAGAATSGPLIAGIAGAGGAMAAATPPAAGLVLSLGAAAPAAGAAAAGLGAVGTAAAAATPSLWSAAAAITVMGAPIYIVVGAIAALAVALILLLLNFDRVVQGLRVLNLAFGFAKTVVLEFVASLTKSIPILGAVLEATAGQSRDALNKLAEEAKEAEEKINSAKGDGFLSGLDDITKLVEAQMNQAKLDVADQFADLNQTMVEQWGTNLAGVQAAAMMAGADDMAAYAKGIKDNVDKPVAAFTALTEAMKTAATEQGEIAYLVGVLNSKELADGLADSRPQVVAQADATKKATIDRLNEITNGAYGAAQDAAAGWQRGWRESEMAAGAGSSELTMSLMANQGVIPEAVASWERLRAKWADVAPTASEAARALDGLKASTGESADVAEQAAEIIRQFGYDVQGIATIGETAGADLMLAIADGIHKGREQVNAELQDLHEMIAGSMTRTARIAYLLAALTGTDMAAGLASSDPMVRAQAIGTRNIIETELMNLTGGAYKAGMAGAVSFGQGYADGMAQVRRLMAMGEVEAANELRNSLQNNSFNPSSLGITPEDLAKGRKAYEDWLASIEKQGSSMSNLASQAKSDMTTAFNEIKAKAMEYFDAIHRRNLQALEDARNHKNAILDVKAALIQAPVTAAQRALDFQRRQIQEWRLRQAVANATDPEAYRDAVLALQDFLAQSHIDDMQAQADAQKERIENQKDANDEAYRNQVEAENRRYEQQKKDFNRQLTALERYLKNHPAEWAKTQNKILELLGQYGLSFKVAGQALGKDFVDGLRSQIAAAQKAADDLAKASQPKGGGTDTGGTGVGGAGFIPNGAGTFGYYAHGAWDLSGDQMARLHAHEMVLRPDIAQGVRNALGGRGMESIPDLVAAGASVQSGAMTPQVSGALSTRTLDAMARALVRPEVGRAEVRTAPSSLGASGGDYGGKTTVVFQVGDETFGEIADVNMYRQQARSSRSSTVRVPGSRR